MLGEKANEEASTPAADFRSVEDRAVTGRVRTPARDDVRAVGAAFTDREDEFVTASEHLAEVRRERGGSATGEFVVGTVDREEDTPCFVFDDGFTVGEFRDQEPMDSVIYRPIVRTEAT